MVIRWRERGENALSMLIVALNRAHNDAAGNLLATCPTPANGKIAPVLQKKSLIASAPLSRICENQSGIQASGVGTGKRAPDQIKYRTTWYLVVPSTYPGTGGRVPT